MVATSDGYLYQYNIDLENGGQCVLLKQFRLALKKLSFYYCFIERLQFFMN